MHEAMASDPAAHQDVRVSDDTYGLEPVLFEQRHRARVGHAPKAPMHHRVKTTARSPATFRSTAPWSCTAGSVAPSFLLAVLLGDPLRDSSGVRSIAIRRCRLIVARNPVIIDPDSGRTRQKRRNAAQLVGGAARDGAPIISFGHVQAARELLQMVEVVQAGVDR